MIKTLVLLIASTGVLGQDIPRRKITKFFQPHLLRILRSMRWNQILLRTKHRWIGSLHKAHLIYSSSSIHPNMIFNM